MADTVEIALSSKPVRFVLDAIDFQIAVHRARIELGTLSDDDRADLGNDSNFLEVVRKTISEQTGER